MGAAIEQGFEAAGLTQPEQRVVHVVAERVSLLAHQGLDLFVRDLDVELLGHRVKDELACNRVKCPKCAAPVVIPAPVSPAPEDGPTLPPAVK